MRKDDLQSSFVMFCIAICLSLVGLSATSRAIDYEFSSVMVAQTDGLTSSVDREGEKLASELVELHLPELRTVLASLKKHSEKEYQKAIGDLARTSRRLQMLEKRDASAYAIEVSLLQWHTRADLALAQLQVHDNQSSRIQLKTALRYCEQTRLEKARYERQRLIERMNRMQSQLARLNQQVESADIEAATEIAYLSATRRLDQQQESATRNKKKSKSNSNLKTLDSQTKSEK